jgi:hypothetical protein
MMHGSIPDAVDGVRESISALRATLLAPSPEALESHLSALEAALHNLQGLQPDTYTRRDMEALAAELRAVGSLIEHGMAIQEGWSRILAAATGGYQPDGEPRPLQPPGSISVQI